MVAIHLLTNNWVVIVIDPHRVVLQNIALTAHQFNPRDAHIVRGFVGISLYARIALAEGLPETYKFGSDSL